MKVFLIRTAPGTARDRQTLERARNTPPARAFRRSGKAFPLCETALPPPPALCFFHGDGVGHALDPEARRAWSAAAAESGLDLMVCETALARRSEKPVEPPWRTGSLAQFWQGVSIQCTAPFACEGGGERERAGDARRRRGKSSRYARIPPAPPSEEGGRHSFLVRVTAFGDDRFNREVLELCLAGAALDMDLVVCFSGDGLELLRGPGATPWRQFPDFELAPLYYVADREIPLDVPAKRLDRSEAERLAEQSGRVIDV